MSTEQGEFRAKPGDFWKRQQIIAEIERGNQLLVVSAVESSRGQRYIDIRNWFQERESGEYRPTQKGVTIPADAVQAVTEAITDAAKAQSDW